MKHKFLPKRYLITGGAGFIGSCFIRALLKKNEPEIVVNLDKLTYAGSESNMQGFDQDPRYHFLKDDICNREQVLAAIKKYEIDTIVHFAAESHVDRSITGPEQFVMTNIVGTFNLLEAARQYWLSERKWSSQNCRFHHISTDEVYGALKPKEPAFSESTPYSPNSPYSASKAGSDHLVRAYFHTYGLPVTATNCSNNYGPYQHAEKFIPTVIRACKERQLIPIYGNGSNIRDWLYVYDHCEAIFAVLEHAPIGEMYNVGGDHELDNLSLATMICDLYDSLFNPSQPSRSLIHFVTDRPGHDWRYAINHQKITGSLGWKPRMSLEQGLTQTIKFYC